MARMNVRVFMAPTCVVNYGMISQVAYYVAMAETTGQHWKDADGMSAEVQFIRVKNKNGTSRRVVMLSHIETFNPSLPTLTISAGGTWTWNGAGPRVATMNKTAISVVNPGAKVSVRKYAHPNISRWHRCLGSWTYGADSTRVQALVVENGPPPRPLTCWEPATAEQEAAYEQWVAYIRYGELVS